MQNEHISRAFQSDLEHLRGQLLAMGGLAEQQLGRARLSFQLLQPPAVADIDALESKINEAQVSIDSQCTRIIAMRQPAAIDLRQIISTLHAVADLERIGDEAKNIMHRALALNRADRIGVDWQRRLEGMGKLVCEMLSDALGAYARLDPVAAYAVIRRDDVVDSEYAALTLVMEQAMTTQSELIHDCLSIVFMAKAFERCGDHAKNLAEYVIAVARGEDIRHKDALSWSDEP